MASDRRRGFEAWARNQGDPAVRAHDRRAIAEDLFELAGSGEVRAEHIEALGRRYRERLAGAQKILLARQIGEEILRYQDEPRAAPARAGDARREDDEVIGIALDTSPGRPIGGSAPPPVATPALDLSLPLPPAPPLAPPAAARVPTGGGTLPRSMTPAQRSASPLPRSLTPIGVAGVGPERPRSGAAQDWAAPPRSVTGARPALEAPADEPETAAQPDAPEGGLWAPLRQSGAPAATGAAGPWSGDLAAPAIPAIAEDVPELVPSSKRRAPSDPPATEAPASPPARRPSSRPPPAMLGRIDVAGMSSRPPPPGADPARRPPSVPPGAAEPVAPTPAAALQGPLLAKIGAGVGVALLVLLIALRPSCIFPAPTREVSGAFASKHLGIAATFNEPWMHAGKRDDSERRGDWRRARSMFYQGVDVDEFAIQLTLVTLSHVDRPASDDDMRSVGASELATGTRNRECAPFERLETKAVRCTSEQTVAERRYAMLEEYFLVGPRIVYARGLVESVAGAPEAAPAEDGASPAAAASPRSGSPLAEIDARRLESILDSIVPLAE